MIEDEGSRDSNKALENHHNYTGKSTINGNVQLLF